MTNTKTRETIDIQTSGQTVSVNVEGRTTLEIAIRGDAAADYALEGRESPSAAWVRLPTTYAGSADYDDTQTVGWHQMQVVCTSGTATVDDTATVILCAGGK